MVNPKKLVRKVFPEKGIFLAEESYRKGRIYSLQARYGFPAKGLRIIAVTGTNGKTSTCIFINELLKSAGYKTALYSTATIEISGKSKPNKTHLTLPPTEQLLRFLREAKKSKADFVVLEATSQALHQHKLSGVPIEIAVMTNLTQDHLDYHRTMANYASAKARLFNNYMKPSFCVLNADDDRYDYFNLQSVGQVVSYGRGPDSTERIKDVKNEKGGMSWMLLNGEHPLDLHIQLAGLFNVYNASAAAAVGLLLGVEQSKIAKGLASVSQIPGRMEKIDAGQPFAVWVDYAVTPDALSKVLEAGKQAVTGKVSVVFGATGDRDKSKRPLMGAVAAKLADRIYLTDDETYSENPESIRQAVFDGIKQSKGVAKTKEIADRKEAIKTAFSEAKKGDLVILTGIGHQDSRNMGGKNIPWDERKVARGLLNKQNK